VNAEAIGFDLGAIMRIAIEHPRSLTRVPEQWQRQNLILASEFGSRFQLTSAGA
jgi:hypothetical protein